MLTVNNKDTRTTPLTSLILNIINIDILNIEHLSQLILVLKLLTLNRQFFPGTNNIKQDSQNRIFLPFDFGITKIWMKQERAACSFDYPVVIMLFVIMKKLFVMFKDNI